MGNLLIAYRDLHRQGRDAVRAVDDVVVRRFLAQVGQGRTYVELDTFRHPFADLHVVLAAHVFLNIRREVVAGHTDGVVADDTAQGNHGNLGAAAADVNDHVTFRCLHVEPHAEGCSHRFEDEIDVASVRMLG